MELRFSQIRGDKMREADIEKRLVDGVKQMGGLALKFVSPGTAGVPDRIILFQGKAYFVELKAPGKKLGPLQKHRKRVFAELGFNIFVVDSLDGVEVMLDAIRST